VEGPNSRKTWAATTALILASMEAAVVAVTDVVNALPNLKSASFKASGSGT
jgi:hypothetical protein